jgi:hypothetical protein
VDRAAAQGWTCPNSGEVRKIANKRHLAKRKPRDCRENPVGLLNSDSGNSPIYPQHSLLRQIGDDLFLGLSVASRKRIPNWSPFSQTSSQRRYAAPVVERTRKNSFKLSPVTDPLTVNFAPPAATSSIRQSLLQVPSIATTRTGIPRENSTRPVFRFSPPEDIPLVSQKKLIKVLRGLI